MFLTCEVHCHNCGHAWVYFGKQLQDLGKGKPVRVKCPRCYAKVAMDAKKGVVG